MKEVTRIRIAKLSYDIDIAAKKKLETYIQALSLYAEDDNMLEDIEIRITELLEKNGVGADGIIESKDVEDIIKTLGEPQHFSGEGDIAIGSEQESAEPTKKLHRDIDGALLGGVLAGFAQFFKINPLWLRLGYVILLFISFGFVSVIYLILWAVMPAAKSVSEKLQMRGEAVSLQNIRKHNENYSETITTQEKIRRRKKVAGVLVGMFGVLIVLSAILGIIIGAIILRINTPEILSQSDNYGIIIAASIASAVFLAVIGAIISYAGFTLKLSKTAVVSGIVAIMLGIASVTSAAGLVAFEFYQKEQSIQESIKERTVQVPTTFGSVKHIIVDTKNTIVEYRVSEEVRATITSVPGYAARIMQDGERATITIYTDDDSALDRLPYNVVVYGPALNELEVKSGSATYTAKTQPLTVSVSNESTGLSLFGTYTNLNVTQQESATVNAEGASVENLSITMAAGSYTTVGTVGTVAVIQPMACPNNSEATLWIENVTTNRITYNGEIIPAVTTEKACGAVRVGELMEQYYY